MGMFDFVKNAGSKLSSAVTGMLSDKEDINQPATISKERMDELQKANIENTIKEMKLPIDGLNVSVDNDQVVVSGNVENQADLEKVAIAAGNTQGISKVDAQIAVKNPEPEAVFYTVVSGDTLGKIAKQHLGASSKYVQIFEANKPMLSDPNKIYPGQVLRIPKA